MPGLPSPEPIDDKLRRILTSCRTIALIGASANPDRPSHGVMKFMQARGYRVIPVNPGLAGQTLLGEVVMSHLSAITEPVHMVDLFRRSDQVGPVVDEAITMGAKVIWMQLDVCNHEAAAKAEAAGLDVILDRCPKIEIMRLGMI